MPKKPYFMGCSGMDAAFLFGSGTPNRHPSPQFCHVTKEIFMAKSLTKSATIAKVTELAGKALGAELSKKQVGAVIDALVGLAYKEAKNKFTLPGLGKLELKNRKARVGRNPKTGEPINIPAKRVVKFRVAKAAKDAILGGK
jgi:DNA-binding protein HU-beta